MEPASPQTILGPQQKAVHLKATWFVHDYDLLWFALQQYPEACQGCFVLGPVQNTLHRMGLKIQIQPKPVPDPFSLGMSSLNVLIFFITLREIS